MTLRSMTDHHPMTYRTSEIEVRGGLLRAGIWESADLNPEDAADRTVLAVHGVTSSHLAWPLVAEQLVAAPRTRFIAPDLRGRGRSADLRGPWGMQQHAEDLQAVIGQLGQPDLSVGHSMGGFVVVYAAYLHPGTLGDLVLVDGGVPLPYPQGVPVETVLKSVLGPAAERLAMTFADHEAYRIFWREHPAFVDDWSSAVEEYVDYDLVQGSDGWHSASRFDAVAEDTAQLGEGGILQAAWAAMVTVPTFLRAPLGLLGDAPGLYPPAVLEKFAATHPGFRWDDVEGTNHYTLVLGQSGAERVSAVIEARLHLSPL